MNTQNDGGPAYPGPDDYSTDGRPIYDRHMHRGMSLRDRIAIAALTGILGSTDRMLESYCAHAKSTGAAVQDVIAICAYQYADAMLRERESGA